jgi:hypothetical protein
MQQQIRFMQFLHRVIFLISLARSSGAHWHSAHTNTILVNKLHILFLV